MKIDMSCGGGGYETAQLIEEYFQPYLNSAELALSEDAAVLPVGGKAAFTTDSFVVKPLCFPGGNIGRLAVCGAVNDLLVMGARPRYLSMGFILETNFDTDILPSILQAIRDTSAEAGVSVVAADTKVVEGDGGLIIAVSGLGSYSENPEWRARQIVPGDCILVTGNLGEHHAAILSSRMGIKNAIVSDAAPLNGICEALRRDKVQVHAMRDITRGGLATVLNELAASCGLQLTIDENELPVSPAVRGFCGILGLDPLTMGNEGKLVAFVPSADAKRALGSIRQSPYGLNAAIIGQAEVPKDNDPAVLMKTRIGGLRRVSRLHGEGLPRIC